MAPSVTGGTCIRPSHRQAGQVRSGRVVVPQGDDALETGEELLVVATSAVEEEIRAALGH